MKHSPGPWKAERDTTTRKTHCWRIHSSDVRDLAGLEFLTAEDCDGYGADNARLIAAAPELADALRELMQYVGGWDAKPGHPCAVARDLLTRFEGNDHE
jgi:hypothetical protein